MKNYEQERIGKFYWLARNNDNTKENIAAKIITEERKMEGKEHKVFNKRCKRLIGRIKNM